MLAYCICAQIVVAMAAMVVVCNSNDIVSGTQNPCTLDRLVLGIHGMGVSTQC
jgi:hypothetical protein